jgi:hypothetical protein
MGVSNPLASGTFPSRSISRQQNNCAIIDRHVWIDAECLERSANKGSSDEQSKPKQVKIYPENPEFPPAVDVASRLAN